MSDDDKPLTTEEIARLRALAEQATPGPYERPDAKRLGAGVVLGGEIRYYVNGSSRPQLALMTGERSAENAAFFAACDPQTVLRLLVAAESAAGKDAEIATLRDKAALSAAIERAARELPERARIGVYVERNAGWVDAQNCDWDLWHDDRVDQTLSERVERAIQWCKDTEPQEPAP